MEILSGLILIIAVYYAGTNSRQVDDITGPKSLEIQQCTEACNSGTVKEFKWCKCKDKSMWEED